MNLSNHWFMQSKLIFWHSEVFFSDFLHLKNSNFVHVLYCLKCISSLIFPYLHYLFDIGLFLLYISIITKYLKYFKFFDLLFLLELIYSVVPISAVQHSDPVLHTYTFFFPYYLSSYSTTRDWM